MTSVSTRLVVSIGLVVSGVGVLDSLVSREWDFLAVFLLSTAVNLALWLRQRTNRRAVTLRPDLFHWVEKRAESSGEPFDDLLDRAVATYKHGLFAEAQHGQ